MVQVSKMGMYNSAERERVREGPAGRARGAEGPGAEGHGKRAGRAEEGRLSKSGCGGKARVHKKATRRHRRGPKRKDRPRGRAAWPLGEAHGQGQARQGHRKAEAEKGSSHVEAPSRRNGKKQRR